MRDVDDDGDPRRGWRAVVGVAHALAVYVIRGRRVGIQRKSQADRVRSESLDTCDLIRCPIGPGRGALAVVIDERVNTELVSLRSIGVLRSHRINSRGEAKRQDRE